MTTTSDTMTDAELLESLEVVEADMLSDGKPFHDKNRWAVGTDSTHEPITGDGCFVMWATASLMRSPFHGCRASHAGLGRRVATLKKLFSARRSRGMAAQAHQASHHGLTTTGTKGGWR